MPKPQRTFEEIEKTKTEILEQTVILIAEVGYNNFTMRKLAARLGITATTIYNYYKNKDDLFLNLLIRGFQELYARLEYAYRRQTTPAEKLRAMIAAYTDFGLNDANFYNLMYAWHVPKYNDYVGTSMEPVARQQLEGALKIPEIFSITIKAYAEASNKLITDDETVFLMIHYWSHIHGFIAGCNNMTLYYLHKDPIAYKEQHIDSITEKFREDVLRLKRKGEKK
ncbi:TetR/AcrR family transcriptional regulator [uncultured Desulfosarcina sp.]|uniref:TetR/AcrR family transcriptional regulator n=1 Tax=uncultured Desulfosarcina sp. TaxID=218289 RepID=UPI0029C693B1|nr:TetR/AcrR family transcriptional regulator [uncultured Desulfosarcina sp.]